MLLKNKSYLRESDTEIKDNCKKYKFILIQIFLVYNLVYNLWDEVLLEYEENQICTHVFVPRGFLIILTNFPPAKC